MKKRSALPKVTVVLFLSLKYQPFGILALDARLTEF